MRQVCDGKAGSFWITPALASMPLGGYPRPATACDDPMSAPTAPRERPTRQVAISPQPITRQVREQTPLPSPGSRSASHPPRRTPCQRGSRSSRPSTPGLSGSPPRP